ncbi:c361a0c2-5094-496b-a3b8-25f7277fa4e8 [Sclerotinia trifoliorum]|uniref:C361a0c2-5094-496b-a3b8-25f7277fa4e8 n=1 Tax=Sclerotinia trifoliorum TaxID=28548 RepID=A0A8H2VP26_9HELO|nr:c361a0c2-5094-496b-a3b8-25f7277fa4e8 [Sclerotinia trifoliorum]
MSSPIDEKSTLVGTNVLTINRPTPSRTQSNQSVLSTIQDVDSTHSLSPSQTRYEKNSLSQETSPLSPFYNPNPTRYSLEAQKSSSKQNITSYDTDVEACLTPQQTTKSGGLLMKAKTGATQECTVWPGQQQMKRKKKAMKQDRMSAGICGCMAGFDKKTRVWIKVLIALVVIALAVGVGVGVSRAVGGGVWKNSQSTNTAIPN